MYSRVAIVLSVLGALACATPAVSPLGAGPISPGPDERVIVDHAYLIVDSSSSVEQEFASQKAMVQSFVGAMPDGTYQSGSVAFGGYAREGSALAGFDRSSLGDTAAGFSHLAEGTPIDRVIGEVAGELGGKTGRAAVVIFSDGKPTDPVGRQLDEQTVLDAAGKLAAGYSGDVCFHTVQTGDDPEGAAFLQKLSSVTSCGTTRTMSSVQNVAALQNFEREVFLGGAATREVAAAPGDADGDGVIDPNDQCPGTPRGAPVDERGCWTIPGVLFAFDSAAIEPQYFGKLDEAVQVLESNPGVPIHIDGHTDSIGPEDYNQSLSERRANAVKEYFVGKGVDASRLVSRGFGEANPAYPNDTRENRHQNRRTELGRAGN
jgi:OOP family OmpA-OmpF porin